MMMNSEARRCGLVVLSAESAERSTPYLCRIFDATWPPCYPDLPGLRIYDPVSGLWTGPGVNFSRRSKVCRLRLGRLVALGRVDCSRQSAVPTPTSAQLRANRMVFLMTMGWTGCVWADCQARPSCSPICHPCLERLLPLGLAYPGTNPPTNSLCVSWALEALKYCAPNTS